MNYKGTAELPRFDPTNFSVGDVFDCEISDWNGSGFRYRASKSEPTFIVVESWDDHIVVVETDDRIHWNTSFDGHDEWEVTINADGTVEGYITREGWDLPMVKNVTRFEKRGGAFQVEEGRRHSGRQE